MNTATANAEKRQRFWTSILLAPGTFWFAALLILPLAVILVVPMCLLCSVAGVQGAQLDVNIFTQIGFVVLVGLACKNAILIVEFPRAKHSAGDHARGTPVVA